MEAGSEVPKINEVRPPTKIWTEVRGEGNNAVNLSVAKFEALKTEGPAAVEKDKLKRLVVFLPGWPWDVKAKPTWDFPGQLSESLAATCYSLSAFSQREDSEGMARQADAMGHLLIDQGLDKDTELIIVSHSAGGRKGSYLTKFLEDNGFEPAVLVLASPMGVNKRGMMGLLRDFRRDTFKTGKIERQRAGIRAGDKNPVIEKVSEQEIKQGFKESLRKRWQISGIRGLWSQIRGLVNKDSIYSQIKAPIIDLANDLDMVSNHRNYIPQTEARRKMAPLTRDDVWRELSAKKWEGYRERVTKSKDWESISDSERQSRLEQFDQHFGSKEDFIAKDSIARARQEERVKLVKAMETVARQIFKDSKHVDVVIPTRQADHNGVIVARAPQVASLIDRTINLGKRTQKAA